MTVEEPRLPTEASPISKEPPAIQFPQSSTELQTMEVTALPDTPHVTEPVPLPATEQVEDSRDRGTSLHIAAQEVFQGRKERRLSSHAKMYRGDALRLSSIPTVIKMLQKYGDKEVVFSEMVVKINKRNKMQDRILMLTDQALYNIDPSGHKMKRRIALTILGSVRLSHLADNFFCLHVPSEYDYLFESDKKSEFVVRLAQQFQRVNGTALPMSFANTFSYCIGKDLYREIQFTSVADGISTQIFSKVKKPKA